MTIYTLPAALFTMYLYYQHVFIECLHYCTADVERIASGQALSPYVYRVLTPSILMAFGNSLLGYLLFHIVMIGVFYALLERWLARWHRHPALIWLAALFFAVAFDSWYFSVYSFTELVMVLCALLWLTRHSSSSAR